MKALKSLAAGMNVSHVLINNDVYQIVAARGRGSGHMGIAMALAEANADMPLADVLSKLEAYRSSIETLIGAPFGTIVLYDLARLPEAAAELAAQDQAQSIQIAKS